MNIWIILYPFRHYYSYSLKGEYLDELKFTFTKEPLLTNNI